MLYLHDVCKCVICVNIVCVIVCIITFSQKHFCLNACVLLALIDTSRFLRKGFPFTCHFISQKPLSYPGHS